MNKVAVELFAGIGGFRIGADSAGIETVFANDISAPACKVYRQRFGDITEGDLLQCVDKIPAHDLLTAGIPCQPFSSAGKKLGVQDPRGTLFQVVVDILKKHSPEHFIIENVKRLLSMENGSHFATILGALASLDYQIEWRLLNALDFGLAQNRQRVVIVGTKRSRNRLPTSYLATADDLALTGGRRISRMFDPTAWTPIENHAKKFATWGFAADGKFIDCDLTHFSEAVTPIFLKQILQKEVDPSFDFTESTLERIANSTAVHQYFQGVEILYNQAGGARMGYTIFGINGTAPTVTSTASRHYERYKIGERFRRLTNVEYARLQGFPDDHCKAVSVYDQYALYGNAFPPPMASWVIGRLNNCAGIEAVESRAIG